MAGCFHFNASCSCIEANLLMREKMTVSAKVKQLAQKIASTTKMSFRPRHRRSISIFGTPRLPGGFEVPRTTQFSIRYLLDTSSFAHVQHVIQIGTHKSWLTCNFRYSTRGVNICSQCSRSGVYLWFGHLTLRYSILFPAAWAAESLGKTGCEPSTSISMSCCCSDTD